MKKILRSFLTVFLVLPTLLGIISTVQVNAAEASSTVDVVVNKRLFVENVEGQNPVEPGDDKSDKRWNRSMGLRQNTGEIIDNFGGEPLNGVDFTVYDVTEAYYTMLETNPDKTDVITIIAGDITTYATDGNKVATQTTAGEGQATFTLDEVDATGRDKAYLFVETATPSNVTITKKAAPFVLVMPIYAMNSDGTFTDKKLDVVHVYPKNETSTDKKEVTDFSGLDLITEDGKKYRNVEIGQEIPFKLTLNIPADIAEVESYKVTDTPTVGLKYVTESLEVTGLVEDVDYILTENPEGGFTLTLKLDSENVKALAGQTLEVTYKMALTEDAIPDEVYTNSAQVIIGGNDPQDVLTPKEPTDPENPEEPEEPVKFVTGGKKFVKTDAHTDEGLGEAQFAVMNEAGQYAKFEVNSKEEYAFVEWVTLAPGVEPAGEFLVISAANTGEFNIVGLKYGTYTLTEITAPEGYVALPDLEFDIVKGGYANPEDLRDVPNTPKGLLPSTGGNGIYAFLIVGMALMTGSYIWFKKSKTQAEV